jgi:hypothetical protein
MPAAKRATKPKKRKFTNPDNLRDSLPNDLKQNALEARKPTIPPYRPPNVDFTGLGGGNTAPVFDINKLDIHMPSAEEARTMGSQPRNNFEAFIEQERGAPTPTATNVTTPKTGFFDRIKSGFGRLANSSVGRLAASASVAYPIAEMLQEAYPVVDPQADNKNRAAERSRAFGASYRDDSKVTVSPGSKPKIGHYDTPSEMRQKLDFAEPLIGTLKQNRGDVPLPTEPNAAASKSRLEDLDSISGVPTDSASGSFSRLEDLSAAGLEASKPPISGPPKSKGKTLAFDAGRKKKSPLSFKVPSLPVYEGIQDDNFTKLPPITSDDIPDQLPLESRDMRNFGYDDSNADSMYGGDNQQSSEAEAKLTAFDRYMDLVTNMPDRKDYKPSIWRRLAAATAGFSQGWLGRDGYGAAKQIVEDPYNTAMSQWKGQLDELQPIAQIENQREMNETRVQEQARKTDLINATKTAEVEIKRLVAEGKIKNEQERIAVQRELAEIRQLSVNGQLEVAKERLKVLREHYQMSDATNRMRANTQATSVTNQNTNRDTRTSIAQQNANKAKGANSNPLPRIREARRLANQDMDQLYPGFDTNTRQATWEKILADPKHPKRQEVLDKLKELEAQYLQKAGVQ